MAILRYAEIYYYLLYNLLFDQNFINYYFYHCHMEWRIHLYHNYIYIKYKYLEKISLSMSVGYMELR